MKLHEMNRAEYRKARKRVGRGCGNNWGRTCGRGEKGQLSRSGSTRRPYFEGGQMPLFRRLPKRGFTSRNHKDWTVVNVGSLDELFNDGDSVDIEALQAVGIIGRVDYGVKVLANGEISKKLTVTAHKFSAAAEAKITAAGGTCNRI
jgi:large subunit ribosomal protein L15